MRDILIVANNDWYGLWFQRQEFASRFAQRGHRVWYFNRTLQRWPTFYHFMHRLGTIRNGTYGVGPPDRLVLVTPIWLPPTIWLRAVNRLLIRRTMRMLPDTQPVLITYVPTYNTLELIRQVRPSLVMYVNVHNYDADCVLPDLLASERILTKECDLLCADSDYNRKRLVRVSGGRPVWIVEPGVDYQSYRTAFRGDEVQRRRTIYYFGGIGPHLDLFLYSELARTHEIVFVGEVSPVVARVLPSSIRVIRPVGNRELPRLLRQADAIAILYKKSQYIDGVVPAKLYECLATGKPLLVSGLRGLESLGKAIYNVESDPERAACVMSSLPVTETEDVRLLRFATGQNADWSRRFDYLYQRLDASLLTKTGKGLTNA